MQGEGYSIICGPVGPVCILVGVCGWGLDIPDVLHDQPLKTLDYNGCQCYRVRSFRPGTVDFSGTGIMLADLRHFGTIACCKEVVKLSENTCFSCSTESHTLLSLKQLLGVLSFRSLNSLGQVVPCSSQSCLITCSEGSHPWLLVGGHSDCSGLCYIICAPFHVIHHSVWVLL